MSERRECFCGRRIVFEFGLTDDDGNAHTRRFCGKDDDGQGLDVNALLSEQMEAHERAWQAEAQVQRVRELPILGKAPQGNTALRGYNDGWNACRMATLRALDGDGDE